VIVPAYVVAYKSVYVLRSALSEPLNTNFHAVDVELAASFPPHDVSAASTASDAAACVEVGTSHCTPVTDFIPAPPVSLAIPPKAMSKPVYTSLEILLLPLVVVSGAFIVS